jgi:hypothetical protein
MERSTSMILGWLAGASALSFGVVGCGALVHQDPSTARLSSATPTRIYPGTLKPCTLPGGQAGLKFNDLCLPAPPAGWTGTRTIAPNAEQQKVLRELLRNSNPSVVVPDGMAQKTSWFEVPTDRQCESSGAAPTLSVGPTASSAGRWRLTPPSRRSPSAWSRRTVRRRMMVSGRRTKPGKRPGRVRR